jgi:hypothetical protein
MSVLSVNFRELYERHLCRHSQFGINVIHLVSLVGTYLAVFGLIYGLVESEWVLVGLAIPYLLLLATNLPMRVFVVLAVFLALFFLAFLALPPVAFWWYLVGIVVCYEVQLWSHKVYSKEKDMTEFNQKYPKGFVLFVVLTVYELPILLNYLIFGKRDWCA